MDLGEQPITRTGARDLYEQLLTRYMPLISFQNFKGQILQGFREIGNSIAVIQLFEEQIVKPILTKRLKWTTSKNLIQEIINLDDTSIAYLNTIVELDPTFMKTNPRVAYSALIAETTDVVGKMSAGPRVFQNSLAQLKKAISDVFSEAPPTLAASFYHIWSVIEFASCTVLVSEEKHIRELFGDGLYLGGSLFLESLGQSAKYRKGTYLLKIITLSQREAVGSPSTDLESFLKTSRYVVLVTEQWMDILSGNYS